MEEFENLSVFWRTLAFPASGGPSGPLSLALDESSNGYGSDSTAGSHQQEGGNLSCLTNYTDKIRNFVLAGYFISKPNLTRTITAHLFQQAL